MAVTVQEAVATWKRRRAAEAALDAQATLQARACLPRLARIARERGASRVWVFGSLVEGRFTCRSDIDLAVEGMPEGALLGLMADLTLLAERHIDVVLLETAGPSLVARIRETGEEVP